MSAGGSPPVGLTPADGNSVGVFSSDRIGGFGYGVGVSVGILLLITTITLASYFCTRAPVTEADVGEPPSRRHGGRGGDGGDGDGMNDVELGIDETTLKGYPEVVYGEARREAKAKKGTTCTCCSICLDNYGDGDVLRMLPECGHLFHRECVDPWLRHHPTCPVCRTSPMPSPMPTPLAEITPLTMARLS
ncbi:putative RING-H2 finger protein ATL71 [Phragmites australis]|uniref:putative RING-H2 finger protein ATL71 n=1 Tax=Phragmites australis TaxID=29695 RepID=UPI002D790F4C|nr:putative RING-H2 finger protein ATL71 [Phragmites australis]